MHEKSIPLTIKSADDGTGTFTGYASVFDVVDAHGDIVRRGAFAKSIASGNPIPLLWEHGAQDPRAYIGDVVHAAETDTGLEITGKFDTSTDFGQAAYRNVKGRRVSGLSIGYRVDKQQKTDAGNELLAVDLIEVSVVARAANDRALVGAVKSAGGRPTAPIRSALARAAAARITTETKADFAMSDNIRTAMLTKNRDAAVTSIKTLIDAADAEHRDLTAEESAEVETLTKTIADCDAGLVQAKADAGIMAQARELVDTVGAPGPAKPAEGGHLAMSGRHAKALAAKMIAALPTDPMSRKALAAGQQTTSTIVLPDVVAEGRPALSLLDVLPTRIVAPSYSFLRQSVRTNNAAPVAELTEKPTSVVSVVSVENRLRVLAHVSEQISVQIVGDNVNLERFVADELVWGLRRALEDQIINGDGTGENFTGILETSGIQLQDFSVDVLTSVRKAITKLDTQGYSAGVVVLSGTDWEAIELLTATSGATDRAVPVDPVARRLWGTRVVLNQSLPAGTGLVIGDGAVTVDHDGVVDTRWSDAVGDDFVYNAVRCRVEGRFGLSVNQPGAIVAVTTAD